MTNNSNYPDKAVTRDDLEDIQVAINDMVQACIDNHEPKAAGVLRWVSRLLSDRLASLAPKPTGTKAGRGVGVNTIDLPKPTKDQQEYLERTQLAVSDFDPETVIRGHAPFDNVIPAMGHGTTPEQREAFRRLHFPEVSPTPDSTGPAGADGLHPGNISAMAEAMWQTESVRCLGKKRLISFDEEGAQERKKWYGLALAADDARQPYSKDIGTLRQSLIATMAALAAAISLLERGGKRGAPSNKMFDQMLTDYRQTLETARSTVKEDIAP